MIAPNRSFHIKRGPVTIKDSDQINLAQHARAERFFEAHEVRFKTMIVGGVAGHLIGASELLQIEQIFLALCQSFGYIGKEDKQPLRRKYDQLLTRLGNLIDKRLPYDDYFEGKDFRSDDED